MAWMIPESIVANGSEVDQATFSLLRQSLPAECAVWYKSALELEPAQQVPFLALWVANRSESSMADWAARTAKRVNCVWDTVHASYGQGDSENQGAENGTWQVNNDKR